MEYSPQKIEQIKEYCMNKPCAYETRPFGEEPICYRTAGKIFAQLSTKEDWYQITVKSNPQASSFYRMALPDAVERGYHCPPVQQPYWNTIHLGHITEDILFQMIDEAYQEVTAGLPKKVQRRLPSLAAYQYKKTDGEDESFAELCTELDKNLEELVDGDFCRRQYEQYNRRDSIQDVILVYDKGKAVACGAYKPYDEKTAELKRIYISGEHRGKGLGKELVRRLEADARIAGYRYAVLETGEPLVDAMRLYKKLGYKIIPNYGQYANMPDSICMERKI